MKGGKAMNSSQLQEENFRQTVIIVEDDSANAEVLMLLLQGEKIYNILSFRSGSEVLANLDDIKSKQPALFLLDYQLSGMNALELYEQFRVIKELEKVPAVIVSATTLNEKQKEHLQQLGLVLIQKPYDIDHLLATIKQVAV